MTLDVQEAGEVTRDSRSISKADFELVLAGLNEIAGLADGLQAGIERLDPVQVHKKLGRIATVATIIGHLHLGATPEEWKAADKGMN